MTSIPDLLALELGESAFTLVAFAGGRAERRASVGTPDRDRFPGDVIAPSLGYLELRIAGGAVELVHGSDTAGPPPVHRSMDEGRTLARIEPPPSTGAVRWIEGFDDGTLIACEGWRSDEARPFAMWVRPPTGGWAARPLPAGFRPEGVSRSPDGTIYVAGGQLPRPHADSSIPQGSPSRPPDSGWAQEALVVVRGDTTEVVRPAVDDEARGRIRADWTSAEHLTGVDARGDPLVVFTRWRDRGNGCAMVVDADRWNVLPDRLLFPKLLRQGPGDVTLYKLGGDRVRTRDNGRTWQRDDLGPAIRAAWPVQPGPKDLIVVDVDAHGRTLAVIVRSLRDERLAGDVILCSADDGATFAAVPGANGVARYQRLRWLLPRSA